MSKKGNKQGTSQTGSKDTWDIASDYAKSGKGKKPKGGGKGGSSGRSC